MAIKLTSCKKKCMKLKETLEDKIWSTHPKLQFVTIVRFSGKIQPFEMRRKKNKQFLNTGLPIFYNHIIIIFITMLFICKSLVQCQKAKATG